MAYMMCYEKKKEREKGRRKQTLTTNLAYKHVFTLSCMWPGGRPPLGAVNPRESIAWQSGGGRLKCVG